MRRKQSKTTVYGPPGTGKTTYLLSLLEEDLKTIEPEKIAFVSFTNKGVDEGKNRAIERFKLKRKQLPYFGTIHSLCFAALGMSKLDIVGRDHYRLFSEKTGINFAGHYTEDYSSPNDAYLHAVEMKHHNPETHKRMIEDLKLHTGQYDFVEEEIGRMKGQLNLKDFTDMLIDFLASGRIIPVRIAYIDEAQDLTPLQWDVVETMFQHTEKLIVAGDDDQAVYEWAGADVERFIGFSINKVMLDYSYRMPRKIHAIARRIVSDIEVRQEKILAPKPEEGTIELKDHLLQVDLQGGELLLARTKHQLRKLSRQLMDEGYLFNFKGKSSVNFNTLGAIMAYANGESLSPGQRSQFYEVSKDLPWWETLKASAFVTKYYRRLLDNKGYIREPIELETFHGSKGSENKHVILATDTSKKVEQMRDVYPDMELRCLFVGVTRTSDRLTILKPTTNYYCPMKYLTGEQYDDDNR